MLQNIYRKAFWKYYTTVRPCLAEVLRVFPGTSESFGPPRRRTPQLSVVLPRAATLDELLESHEDGWIEFHDGEEMEFGSAVAVGMEHENLVKTVGKFKQPPSQLFALHQARIVDSSGTTITCRDEIFGEISPWGFEEVKKTSAYHALCLNSLKFLEGTYIYCLGVWSEGYFHWMFDLLSRIIPLSVKKQLLSLPVLVPPLISSFQRESLQMLGFSNFLELPERGVKVERLLFPTPVRNTHCPPLWILERMRDACGVDPAILAAERIYVSRHDANRRRVVNEDELFRMLQEYGFKKVFLSGKPLKEQVQIFNQAGYVIGPHGSNFTNLVFGLKGMKVLELFSPHYLLATPTFALAKTLGMDYSYLIGDASGETDMVIPVNQVRRVINRWGLTPVD